MDPRLKNLLKLLRDEKTPLQTLSDALAPHLSALKKNESDRVFAIHTVQRLQREWLQKKARCN